MRGGKVPPWSHKPGRAGSIPARAKMEGTSMVTNGLENRGG